jgi:hypothetical protein
VSFLHKNCYDCILQECEAVQFHMQRITWPSKGVKRSYWRTVYDIYCIIMKCFLTILKKNSANNFNVVFFLLGDFPASEFYVSTFRNTLSIPSPEVL